MSTAWWFFAAGPSRGRVRQRRVFGPVGTGPRLERRPQRRGRCSFPLGVPSTSAMTLKVRPLRGVNRCAERRVRPLASVFQRGPRRQTAGMEGGSALWCACRSALSSLEGLWGLLACCSLALAADRGRRLSDSRVVSRPLARRLSAGSLCDAGLMRRAPGLGLPRFGTALPALCRISDPIRDSAGGRG